jgi:hypothetical protein
MAHGWSFLIFYSLLGAGLAAFSYYNVRRLAHYFSVPLSRSVNWFVFALPVSFPIANLITISWPHPLSEYLYTLVATLVGIDFILFSWLLVVDLLRLFFHWSPRRSRPIIIVGASLLILIALLQGQMLTTQTITLSSPYLTKPLHDLPYATKPYHDRPDLTAEKC